MVKLYAEESIQAGRWKESEKLLPNKYETPNNYMYNILNDEAVVGYIWAGSDGPEKKEVFIYAFEGFEDLDSAITIRGYCRRVQTS
ncbi:hypothetical protein [Sediminispirochaeta smaragdinae]|uniref:GCN5-related N-acetyltransferase n=1 Tax=Sediminispirochaeta smaragdinae (strain DSM 11293 / JCM 15392 / SEBR 4228) TaxID=573413 RepID=E1R9S2_SEDSS|nr:hypothetical protein [Sediminispirochaeta smaragdinae]ADK83241.1 hypothetical protein Spirs_4163 [Sediminispirochaeta smaragdinae DSM 11293]